MIVKKANGHGGRKVWYERKRDRSDGTRWRNYHVINLSFVVCSKGSFWRLIVGRWSFAWAIKGRGR